MKTNQSRFRVHVLRHPQDMTSESQLAVSKDQRRCEPHRMKTITAVLLTVLAALLWISVPSVLASELVFSQSSDNQSTYGPSLVWSADNVNAEVADDFNVAANIDRVSAGGFVWGAVNFQGVHVRFYAFGADNKPGALQREYFLAAGDPNVTFDQNQARLTQPCLPPSLRPAGISSLSSQSSTIGTGGVPAAARRTAKPSTSATIQSARRGTTATTSTPTLIRTWCSTFTGQ